jgi:two-component system chemotaxis response regulator CheY
MMAAGRDGANAGNAPDRGAGGAEKTLKVCLVEDDRDLRDALSMVLERAGYETRSAGNGRQAIPLLSEWQPDVVVCDMIMPDGEGFEVLRNARSTVPNARFVMMSGATGEILDVLATARLLGADAILRKPFTPDELLETLAPLRNSASSDDSGSGIAGNDWPDPADDS